VLREDDGALSGEITETVVGADGAAQARSASIEGGRLSWKVEFTKQYASQPAAGIEYEGEIDDEAGAISGYWSITRNVSGSFTMTRETAG
jgi:hypothetical protein